MLDFPCMWLYLRFYLSSAVVIHGCSAYRLIWPWPWFIQHHRCIGPHVDATNVCLELMLQPLPTLIPFFGGPCLPRLSSSSLACQVFSCDTSAALASECRNEVKLGIVNSCNSVRICAFVEYNFAWLEIWILCEHKGDFQLRNSCTWAFGRKGKRKQVVRFYRVIVHFRDQRINSSSSRNL